MSSRIVWLVGLSLLVASCGGSSEPTTAPDLEDSKVAVLGIAVATGGEGHGFFDNVLTCPRRGVINYLNTPAGRTATFSGCDTGDGVVVDGDAEVRWASGGDRSRITRLDIVGALRVRHADGTESTVASLSVDGVSFSSPTEPSVLNLIVAPVRIISSGKTFALDERATPAAVFAPGRAIDAIPNPTGSLDALTAVDTRTIALGNAMRLARLLFEETLESQRGAHEHVISCGRVGVVPEPATQLVRLDNTWTACDLGGGIIVSGTFTQRWTAFGSGAPVLTMLIEGQMILGGNVPRTEVTRLEWSAATTGLPGVLRVSGRLVNGAAQRTFSFDITTDD